jgi:hypothetical protein
MMTGDRGCSYYPACQDQRVKIRLACKEATGVR